MASQPEALQLIGLDEAAERLGVHVKTVYRMQERGELPTIYIGDQRCTSEDGVEAILTTPDPVVVFADPAAVERAAARHARRNDE